MARPITVDFEGVESGGGGSVRVPEGDYGFKISKVVQKVGKESGNPCLLFDLKVIKGDPKGMNKTLKHNCTLTKNALWNLRNLLEATGKTIPSKALKIDLDKLINLELAGTVIDDEYEGKKKSQITSFFPLAELGAEEESGESVEEAEAGEGEEAETGEEEEELF